MPIHGRRNQLKQSQCPTLKSVHVDLAVALAVRRISWSACSRAAHSCLGGLPSLFAYISLLPFYTLTATIDAVAKPLTARCDSPACRFPSYPSSILRRMRKRRLNLHFRRRNRLLQRATTPSLPSNMSRALNTISPPLHSPRILLTTNTPIRRR